MNTALELPVHFADTLFISAAFHVPSQRARALLPDGLPIHLVEVFPRRTVLVVNCALYRQSPFGTYAEATLALMASHEKTTPVLTLARLIQESRYPAYVLHMLVDSEEARLHGREVWGLPRHYADVRMHEEGGQAICVATLDGQQVMQVAADRPVTNRARTMQIETYSLRTGELLHTVMHCTAGAYGRHEGGGATLTWGDHPIGQQMAALEISPQPLMVRYYDQMQAELAAPIACAAS